MENGLLERPFQEQSQELRPNPSTIVNDHNQSNKKQRLIPLTQDIISAMMDFNRSGSPSNTSISEKAHYKTFSITSLVREEVHSILHELSITDQFIRKEEIDELIERCLKEKTTKVQARENTTTMVSESDTNQEIEVTVEMVNENDKDKLIVENFQILEQRITNLESSISTLLQSIPKLRHIQAKKFKINTDAIREELKTFMDKMEQNSTKEPEKETKVQNPAHVPNPYDDMYYEHRQNAMNILKYEKSLDTIELNRRPHLNPYIRPIKEELPKAESKRKHRAMFICNNV